MEKFCGSKFWDTQLTWNTTDPYFTICFEETVLATSPVVLLLLFALLDASNIIQRSRHHIDPGFMKNWLTLIRTLLTVILIGVYAVHLIRVLLIESAELKGADYLSPAVHLLGYVVLLILFITGKFYSVHSSGVQFFYWLFAVICEAILFRTAMSKDSLTDKQDIIYFTRILVFPLTCLQFLLEWVNPDFCKCKSDDGFTENLDKPCPSRRATFASKLFFFWNDSMAWKGYRRPLTTEDLWDLDVGNQSKSQIPLFYKRWNKAKAAAAKKSRKSGTPVQASIVGPLVYCYGASFALAFMQKLCADWLQFIQPLMLKLLVSHISDPADPAWKGYLYVAVLFCTAVTQSVLYARGSKGFMMVGMRIKTVLSNAVYEKALVISNTSKKESTVGQIVNLMAVDTQKFVELMPYLNLVIGAPIQICVAVILLYSTLGVSVFAGLSVILLLIPLNGFLSICIKKLQTEQMKLKDQRIHLLSQVLSGIKVLKLYAWEIPFLQRIQDIRNKELKCLRTAGLLNTKAVFTFQCAPFMIAVATFSTYILSDSSNVLTSERAFVALTLFNIIRSPTNLLPYTITLLIQANVSINRLNTYLSSDELDVEAVSHEPNHEYPVIIEKGRFSWTDESVTLKDINFRVKRGELVAVVGTIGSGKTSLLSSLLGELKKHQGIVNISGTVAYVSQGAWIQNATLRNNILFGDSFQKRKYENVLDACALREDIRILPDMDSTEIGEKGINLSGGQKQRLALARAAYKEHDIYLLDDALSAVDAYVGKHIFDNLIGPNGLLANTTRVFVTHGINFLPKVDRIVVMKDGMISESGSYQELLSQKGEFAELLLHYLGASESEFDNPSLLEDLGHMIGKDELERRRPSARDESTKNKLMRSSESERESEKPEPRVNARKLIEDEKLVVGGIRFKVLIDYMRSAGVAMSLAVIVFVTSANVALAYGNIWLSKWSTDVSNEELAGSVSRDTNIKYLTVYGCLGATQALFILLGAITLTLATLRATSNLHSKSVNRVLRAPMSYFDTTPLGRILNRFSRDVDTTDNVIPLNIRGCLSQMLNMLGNFVVISYNTTIFVALIIPVFILYLFLQRFYVASSRQLRRLDSVSRSPVYTHFGETISGSTIIRAFRLQRSFVKESENLIDSNLRAVFPFMISNLWITIRLELIGAFIVLGACMFTLNSRESLTSGSAGLTISYVLQITTILNFLARLASDLETNVVSVERLTELTETPQEAAWEIPRNQPEASWPEHGSVNFENYQTRYREGLELVLKGISYAVKPGEKVGIVGRTGAGKSSMTLALFRLIEPAGGRILLDGVDISKIGLHDLRKNVTIIPQDPVLFTGTLRSNLDPFNSHSDEQVWKCLELANLKTYIDTLPEGLFYSVDEDGQNFSFGQKQLICLARALLRKTTVIILDEATSSVDFETDEFIQLAIRKEFSHSTVITIAHRLNTIMDYDRVIVLDNGTIQEFDSPAALLSNENSLFSGLARDAKIKF